MAKAKKKNQEKKDESQKLGSKASDQAISVGDQVLINSVVRLAKDNRVLDTTYEELAKKEGIFEDSHRYGPQFIVVGEKFVFEEVDQKLPEMKVGEKGKFELENPFGKRDPQNIKTFSIREFKKANIDVRKNLGKRVNFKGRQGYILSERGGRVRMDYNHPLANEKILYEVEIVKKLSEPRELLDQILKMNFQGIELDKLDIIMEAGKIIITLPVEVAMYQNISYAKFGTARFISEYLKDIEEVEFREVFKKDFLRPKIPEGSTETKDQTGESEDTDEGEKKE